MKTATTPPTRHLFAFMVFLLVYGPAWLAFTGLMAQSASKQADTTETILRTSDFEKTTKKGKQPATTFHRPDRPPGQRIGCLCMDGSESTQTGNGACAGHGGVRFWTYQLENEEVYYYPTNRHLLDSAYEKYQFNYPIGPPPTHPSVPEKPNPQGPNLPMAEVVLPVPFEEPAFSQPIFYLSALLMVCTTIMYIVNRAFRK